MNSADIKNKVFETGMRGYRQEEVHNYLVEIANYIDSLQEEKADLLKKMEVLALKVEEYRKDEESIREALLGAQKMGKQVLNEANKKSETITSNAKLQSEKMLKEAKTESEKMLVEAKNVSKDLLAKTKVEAEKITAEAKQSVETVVRSTKYQIDKEQSNLLRLQREVTNFKSQLLDIYRAHIDLIKKLPELEEPKNSQEEVKQLNKKIYEQKSEDKKSIEQAKNVVINQETVISDASKSFAPNAEMIPKEYPGMASMKIQETKEYDKSEMKGVNEQYRAKPDAALEKETKTSVEKENTSSFEKTTGPKEHYTEKFGDLQFGTHNNK